MNCPTSPTYASFEKRLEIDRMTLNRRPFAFAVIATLKCSGGLLAGSLDGVGVANSELAADIALELSKIIQRRRKVGWQNDRDVENAIRNDVDDFFFEELRAKRGLTIDPGILDTIVDDVLASARVRLAQ